MGLRIPGAFRTPGWIHVLGAVLGVFTGLAVARGYYLALVGAVLAVVFLWKPELSVYAMVVLAPLTMVAGSLLKGNVGRTLMPTDILLFLGAAGGLYRVLAGKARLNLQAGVMAWILAGIVGVLLGVMGGREAVWRESRGLLVYVLIPLWPALFNFEGDVESKFIPILSRCLLAANAGVLLGALGTYNSLTGQRYIVLAQGLYRNVGDSAIAIPAVFLGLSGLAFKPRDRSTRAYSWWLTLMGTAVLTVSVTRGFWLGTAVGLVGAAWLVVPRIGSSLEKRAGLRLAWGLAVLGVCLAGSAALFARLTGVDLFRFLIQRFQMGFYGRDPNVLYRIEEARAYFHSFLSSPLLGHGLGSEVYLSFLGRTTTYCHNDYLYILQTMGLLGLAGLGFLLVTVARVARDRFLYGSPDSKVLAAGLLGMLIAFSVTSMTSPEFRNIGTSPALALWIGAVLTGSRTRPHSPEVTGGLPCDNG